MPIKSMPMPMQSKIGDASLKFGPDWLRALSSDSSTSSPTSPWSGGSGGGGGTPLSNNNNSPSGGGGGGGGNGYGGGGGSNHHQGGGGGGYHQHQSYNSGGYSSRTSSSSYSSSVGAGTGSSSGSQSVTNRNYKPSEFQYAREEFLSLYDKNLSPPEFLPAFGTLFIEKMQPPLAFSQPSEDELRIWHIPQPESSRQANMSGPPIVGRGGYAIRGRGSGIERGRGRGRGGYYGRPPYEEEERVAFSRPRAFERSLSAHDRASWAERNGTVVGGHGTSPPDDGGARGGGSWRNKGESWGPSKRVDDDDGWRKPRWRRDEEDDGQRRRLQKSWSEDGAHDNLPEWAKDTPDDREGGTFDSSGAFHEEDGGWSAKTNAFEKRRREERERSSSESESFHGSHNDRVQKKTPDRNSMKAVIPPSLKEEADESGGPEPGDKPEPSMSRSSRGSSKEPADHKLNSSSLADSKMNDGSGSRHKGDRDLDNKKNPERSTFGKSRNSENEDSHPGKSQNDSHHSKQGRKQQMDEDQYLDMTEEASSLVAKLIDEDGSGGAKDPRSHNSSIPMMVPIGMSHSSSNIPNHGGGGGGPNAGMNLGMDRISPGIMQQQQTTPLEEIDAMETWFYRDPQGNVQGPFRSTEMHQWFAQGYFTGGLLLRRECDKIFITLYEMGKLYDRNPFDPYETDSPPPPPIMEPQLSALEQEAQFQQKQQLLQQQLREQKYLHNMNQNAMREPPVPDRWGNVGTQQVQQQQQQHGGVIGQGAPEVTTQVQAQMILNLVKNAGANVDPNVPNPLEHLQAMFNRQAQVKGGEPQSKADFVNSLSMLQSQLTAQMDHQKSQPSVGSSPDAMQSLLQQLTALSSQQQLQPQMQKPSMPKTTEAVGGGWGTGQPFTAATPQMQAQMPWMQQQPNQNTVWEYRDQMMKLQQQKMQEEELRRKKLEEDKERKQLIDEEERRREEQKRAELEEEKRKMIEEQLKEKYLLQKKQQEEIIKHQEAELTAARRREEEKRLELEEEKRKALMLQEQLMQQMKQEEMMRQHQEIERARIAEMQRQQYEQQKLEQQRLQEQHRLQEQQRLMEQQREQMREEEQRRQEHEELQRRERDQREEQHRREREEQQRREQQQKFSWNSPPSGPGSTLPITQTRTLLEIQQEEAVKQQEEIVRQQVLKKKQMQQAQEQQRLQQQNTSFKWAQAAQTQKVQAKSFTEIQAEEAAKLAQQQEKERETRAVNQHHSQQQQMWSSSLTWANRASLNAPTTSKTNGGGGAWGDSSPTSGSSANKSASNKSQSQFPTVQQTQKSQRPGKESDDNLMKLFQEHSMKQPTRNQHQQSSQSEVPEDEFTRWCFTTVKNMATPGMDVPIFINFLKEVESPFEVNDYIVSYLGEGRDAREFGKEFLERRSRWRNANKGRKDSGGLEDNLCRPASAVNPVNSEFQEVKGKKGKKGKMQKVDSLILGFTTNADRNKRGDYGGDSTD